MGLELYLIRHAESIANTIPDRIGGRSSASALSSLGEEQAHVLAVRFLSEGIRFDEIHTSTAVRAISTAEATALALGYSLYAIKQSSELEEISQGMWEGKSRKAIYTPELRAEIAKTQPYFRAPGGESQVDVEKRMRAYIRENIEPLAVDGRDVRVALFSHGLALRCWMMGQLGWSPRTNYTFGFANTGISRFTLTDGEWCPLTINDYAHLSQCLVSLPRRDTSYIPTP